MKINRKSIAVVLALGQLLTACGILPKEEEFQAAPLVQEFQGANYGKTKVVKGDMVDSEKVRVNFQGTTTSEMTHRDAVKVNKVFVKKGSKVKAGDVLVRYYMEEYANRYEQADYNIKKTEMDIRHKNELLAIEIEKQKKVGGTKAEIQSVKDQYQAEINQIESNLKIYRLEKKEAKDEMRNYELRSNISGTVTYVKPDMEGKMAEYDNLAVRISGAKKNRFKADTEYAAYFKDGDIMNITVSQEVYKAKVKRVGKNSDIVYFYPLNKKLNFKEGQIGIALCIIKQKKDVLYLPSGVVYQMGNKSIVYIEDENGMKEIVEVQKGVEFNHLTEIIGGLKEGQEVITN